MKILALGATGAIGSHLIEHLAPLGHEIHVTSRRARTPSGPVRYVQGNAQDDDFLRRLLLQDWDVIVDFMVYGTEGFRRRINALLCASGQYVFISSARVFADSSSPLVERSPRLLDAPPPDPAFIASDEYALAKARQEDMLRASGKPGWTIVRPYITFSEGRLQLGTLEKESWLYRALKGRSIVFCGPMTGKLTTMTEGADVARMIAALMGNPAAQGEDYNLIGGKAVAWGEVLDLYLDELEAHLGSRPKVVMQDVPEFCRAAASTPQVVYDRMYDRRFDPAKIGGLFDMGSLTDPMPALRDRLRAQLAGGGFLPLQGRGKALRDRAAGERTSPRELVGLRSKLSYILYRYIPSGVLK
jgi:nucleoside-diphosphate-sugar epimerase